MYKTTSTISTSSDPTHRLLSILSKPLSERDNDQSHFLHMVLKKQIKQIKDVADWWIRYECIQFLQLKKDKQVDLRKIVWIYVLVGQFYYFGMIFGVGQHMEISKTNYNYVTLKQHSLFAVLTLEKKQFAKQQAKEKKIIQQRLIVRDALFENNKITNKQFHRLYAFAQQRLLKKNQKLNMEKLDNMIFVVVEGSIVMDYQWKRIIKLRELRIGSIFSSFLGGFFAKNDSLQNMQFSYQAKQATLIIGFCADIFDEDSNRYIIKNAWNIYLHRVAQMKRILSQLISLQPQQQPHQPTPPASEQLQHKYQKQKLISKQVASQRMTYRRIALSLSTIKSSRRRLPNQADTYSIRQITLSLPEQLTHNTKENHHSLRRSPSKLSTSHVQIQKSDKIIKKMDWKQLVDKTKTQKFNHNQLSPSDTCFLTPKTTSNNTNTSPINPKYFSPHSQKTLKNTKSIKTNEEDSNNFYKFFRPQEFVSNKLKNQYVSILMKLNKQKITKNINQNPERIKKYKYKKEQFEQYINQRRIMKLGPKKRYLFKSPT